MSFALPLPEARCVFVDVDGQPLVGGTVTFYEPGGTTPKDTWQDYDQQVLNTNPVTLDALGSASIWGSGRYRQVLKDSLGNLIWDKETAALTDRPYEVGFYFPDTTLADDVMLDWNFTESVTFPTNWTGAFGSVITAPDADTTIDLKKVSGATTTTIGAITVTAAGAVSATSSVSTPSFDPGERFRVQIQSGGSNGLAGLSMTFLGQLN